jgi:hypothetical protein
VFLRANFTRMESFHSNFAIRSHFHALPWLASNDVAQAHQHTSTLSSRKRLIGVDRRSPLHVFGCTVLGSPMTLRFLAAPLAELVDAPDSKSGSERSAGSIPAGGTIFFKKFRVFNVVWGFCFARSPALSTSDGRLSALGQLVSGIEPTRANWRDDGSPQRGSDSISPPSVLTQQSVEDLRVHHRTVLAQSPPSASRLRYSATGKPPQPQFSISTSSITTKVASTGL